MKEKLSEGGEWQEIPRLCGTRYFRLNTPPPSGDIDLACTDSSEIEQMARRTVDYIRDHDDKLHEIACCTLVGLGRPESQPGSEVHTRARARARARTHTQTRTQHLPTLQVE